MPEIVIIPYTMYHNFLVLSQDQITSVNNHPVARPVHTLGFNNLHLFFMPNWEITALSSPWDLTSPMGELNFPEDPYDFSETIRTIALDGKQRSLVTVKTNFPYMAKTYAMRYNTKLGMIDPTHVNVIYPPSREGGKEMPARFIREFHVESNHEDRPGRKYKHMVRTLDPVEHRGGLFTCVHAPIGFGVTVEDDLPLVSSSLHMPHRNQGVWILASPTSAEYNVLVTFITKVYELSEKILDLVLSIDNMVYQTVLELRMLPSINYKFIIDSQITALHRIIVSKNEEYNRMNQALSEGLVDLIKEMADFGMFMLGEEPK